jgi:hypothetical protein
MNTNDVESELDRKLSPGETPSRPQQRKSRNGDDGDNDHEQQVENKPVENIDQVVIPPNIKSEPPMVDATPLTHEDSSGSCPEEDASEKPTAVAYEAGRPPSSAFLSSVGEDEERAPSVIAEAVFFDENVPVIPDEYDQYATGLLQREREEELRKMKRKSRLLILALVVLCLAIGGVVGAVIGITRSGEGNSQEPDAVVPLTVPLTSEPTYSPAPTYSFAPSGAPTCSGFFEQVASVNISGNFYEPNTLDISRDASTAVMIHRRIENLGQPALFFFDTIDFAQSAIQHLTEQHQPLNVDENLSLSSSGDRLVVGVRSHQNDQGEVGGMLFVYFRRGDGWGAPVYSAFVGGGVNGAVLKTATNDAGTVFAVTAGTVGSDTPTFVRAYRVAIGQVGTLVKMGQDILDPSFTKLDTLVALSGSGSRLFVFTVRGEVQIFDYAETKDEWIKVVAESSPTAAMLRASRNGRAFLSVHQIGDVDSLVYKQRGNFWTNSVLQGPPGTISYYQFGSISGDGGTVALAHSFYQADDRSAPYNTVYIYQDRHDGWKLVDEIQLEERSYLIGISLNENGDKLAVVTHSTAETYALICGDTFPTTSPAPTSSVPPTISPTCLDTVAPGLMKDLGEAASNTLATETDLLISQNAETLVDISPGSNASSYKIETYDLTDDITPPMRTESSLQLVPGAALSDDGDLLVAADTRGKVFLFARSGLEWSQTLELQTGSDAEMEVFSTAISGDGNVVAYVAGSRTTKSFIVSVHSVTLSEGPPMQTGNNTLSGAWLDNRTVVGISEDRIFVSSSDGFVRAYDMVDGALKQVGQELINVDSSVYLASMNKSVLAIASPLIRAQIFELRDNQWEELDLTVLNGLVITANLVSFRLSTDGIQILTVEQPPKDTNTTGAELKYGAKLFERVDDTFYLVEALELTEGGVGAFRASQLTISGDFVVAFEGRAVLYVKVPCVVS